MTFNFRILWKDYFEETGITHAETIKDAVYNIIDKDEIEHIDSVVLAEEFSDFVIVINTQGLLNLF